MKLPSAAYFRPGCLAELLQMLQDHPEARILAGGTDLLPQSRKSGIPPAMILDPGAFRAQLAEVKVQGGFLAVGAFSVFREVMEHLEIKQRFGLLVEACRWIGSRQIRNMATIGGNVANASPAGDSLPPLLVYEAVLRLRSLAGSRDLSLDQFFLDYKKTALAPGEIIEAILLPLGQSWDITYYRKAGPRRVLAISRTAVAGAAAFATAGRTEIKDKLPMGTSKHRKGSQKQTSIGTSVSPGNKLGSLEEESKPRRLVRIRLAAAGVAPIPKRLTSVEELILATSATRCTYPSPTELEAALHADISPITDLRGPAEYKFQVTLNFVQEMVEKFHAK